MKIVWGHEMMGCMLLTTYAIKLCTRESQYKCKWTKTCVQWKPPHCYSNLKNNHIWNSLTKL